ncbi:nitroreductase [Alsobacter soli]|uniref:Putative NAD(P)H nitroreductase n=1 Tax=Alsobacter soli TaxID=2109933 RepID=A0A2T1HS00_9HYPH|nr:nitroreductase [Alsobacter soli]PSC04431.1 nitroreductase [Alsobacter soli]
MTDTLTLLQTRRSVPPHLMTGQGPTAQELETLLTVATRVPDHGKLAPWRFVLIEGEARARLGERIAAVFKAANPDADDERMGIERGRFTRAPLVIAVVSRAAPHVKIPEWEQILSAGAVCMNLTVAANAMGFKTAWLTEWMAYDARAREAIGLATDETIAGFIHIGRGEPQPDRARPALADVVTRWGE